uniref:Uncharacterized protein n=1 Tax=Anguilla anguilla TaxID=7936 RepID=A0A0E9UGT6_ANGAN
MLSSPTSFYNFFSIHLQQHSTYIQLPTQQLINHTCGARAAEYNRS